MTLGNRPCRLFVRRRTIQGAVDSAGRTKGLIVEEGRVEITPDPAAKSDFGDEFTKVAAITDAARWVDLINFIPPAFVLTSLSSRGYDVQYIENATGRLNLDIYKVEVTQMPVLNGTPATPQELLVRIRLHLNDFVSGFYAKFYPHDSNIDTPKWQSSNPLGAVLHIDMLGFDDGAIVVSEQTSDHWNFTTITVPEITGAGVHPVSGTRQIGFYQDPQNRNVVFFTRGADRSSGLEIPEDVAFFVGHRLWVSFQNKVHDFITDNGGVGNHPATLQYALIGHKYGCSGFSGLPALWQPFNTESMIFEPRQMPVSECLITKECARFYTRHVAQNRPVCGYFGIAHCGSSFSLLSDAAIATSAGRSSYPPISSIFTHSMRSWTHG